MTIREFSAFTTMSSLSIGASAFETGRVHVELHRLTAHRSLGRVGGSFHTVAISESCPVVGPFRYGSQGSKRRGPLVRAVQTAGPSSAARRSARAGSGRCPDVEANLAIAPAY